MGIVAGFMVPHPPMIVPDIGRGSEAQVADTSAAYERVADEIAALAPETIIITSPHSIMYADYFHISPGRSASGSFAGFRAPGVRFSEEYDTELVMELCRLADKEDFPAGALGERDKELDHGTMVPLWFIRNRYKSGKIVRIGLSGLPLIDHYRLGMIIREAVENTGRRVVFVASGDLSHKLQDYGPYGYVPEGPEYDERIMDVMGRAAFGELLDFDTTFCDKAAECGHRSFVIMGGAFDGTAVKAERLVHQDVTGVGYGICTFYPEEADDSRHFLERKMTELEDELRSKREKSDEYVRLAREAVEAYVLRHEVIDVPAGLPDEMLSTQAGAFVSIHEHGELRGCIGTISATRSCVAEEIIGNAISSSTRDPRFPAIKPDELPWLDINVDVLGEPEDIDSEDELDVKRYGVIVSCGHRRGLLLPDLDGIDTPQQQVEIAMKKGGIHKFEKYKLQRFEVIRHY
ncbi:MAG: AmmeMemoRadiSam system protein A [Mogibacterium sp.]|nr:AmmeMemoRadiSam system protein A [Mogibacterium sp.]